MPPLPPLTKALMLICTAVFFADTFVRLDLWFALWPLQSGMFLPWQVVSYGFLHGSLTHLAFNMLGLWMFGSELERLWGQRRYMFFLLAGVLAAAAVQLVFTMLVGARTPTVGASGALFALLLAYGMLFPERTIMPLFPPIPMKARTFVIVFGAISLFLGLSGGGGVAIQNRSTSLTPAGDADPSGTSGVDTRPAMSFALGVGTTPAARFAVGGIFRVTTFFEQGTDLAIGPRFATGGFARGDFGLVDQAHLDRRLEIRGRIDQGDADIADLDAVASSGDGVLLEAAVHAQAGSDQRLDAITPATEGDDARVFERGAQIVDEDGLIGSAAYGQGFAKMDFLLELQAALALLDDAANEPFHGVLAPFS